MTLSSEYEYDWEVEARLSYEKEMLLVRAKFDPLPLDDLWSQALVEDYDRDWDRALLEHDWRTNRCTGHDGFGARCNKRAGHKSRHDATLNGYLQFVYDEAKINAVVYESNPLLSLIPR